jgi:hypothetical protein
LDPQYGEKEQRRGDHRRRYRHGAWRHGLRLEMRPHRPDILAKRRDAADRDKKIEDWFHCRDSAVVAMQPVVAPTVDF